MFNASKDRDSVETSPTKETEDQGQQKLTEDESPTPPLPEHTVLTKGRDLVTNAKDLAENKDILEAEFSSLREYVNKNINKTRMVGQMDENRVHNRYMDVGKVDFNLYTSFIKVYNPMHEF